MQEGSPALRAELIGNMHRNGLDEADAFAWRFSRWVLSASETAFAGFSHGDTYYRDVAERVRSEELAIKGLVREATVALA
jgi:hypothetical protein